MKDETHVEVDEIWHKRRFVYFAIGRKINNFKLSHDRDYRDVIKFLQGIPMEIRYSDRITFVSDAYVNYLNLLPDYVENCVIVNKKELKKRKNKELRKGLGEVNRIVRFFA